MEEFQRIKDLFVSNNITDKISTWKEEISPLREIVNLFWCTERNNFKQFYEDKGNGNIKEALVMTCIEEISEIVNSELFSICCEELVNLEQLHNDFEHITNIYELLCNNEENIKFRRSIDQTFHTFVEHGDDFIKEDIDKIVDILSATRSHLLANFMTNLSIIYQQLDSSVEHTDLSAAM